VRAGNFHFPGEENIINIFTHTRASFGQFMGFRTIYQEGRCGAGREATDTNCPPHVRAFPPRIMIYKRRTGHPVPDNGTSGSRHSDNRLNWPFCRSFKPKALSSSAASFPKNDSDIIRLSIFPPPNRRV